MTRIAPPDPRRARFDDERMAALFRAAGPPPPTPELEIARIQEATRAHWRRRFGGRAETRWRWQLAAAAAIVAVLGVLLWPRLAPAPRRSAPLAAASLAVVERIAGEVRYTPSGGSERTLGAGEALGDGRLASAEGGRLALRWTDGRSLRLDAGSELLLAGADAVELRRGGLYLDSAGGLPGGGPAVTTEHGRFVETGTQFEVRVGVDATVRLRVREGAVEFRDNGRRETAAAGAELAIGADGVVQRGEVAAHGEAWAWVLDAAPVPAIEGWTLQRFLAWYERESGLEVVYADEASAGLAAQVVLHGSTARLRPAEALAAAAASAGFEVREGGGRLVATASPLAP